MFNFYGPINGDIFGVGDGELVIHSDSSGDEEEDASDDELIPINPPIIVEPPVTKPLPIIVDPLVPQGRYAKKGQYCGSEYTKCKKGLRCVARSSFGIDDGKKICVDKVVRDIGPFSDE